MKQISFALALAFALAACGKSSPPPASPQEPPMQQPPATGACIKTGCSSTICAEPGNEQVTTCEFRPEYACYQNATCERQADGKCAWTETPELTACLASPPPVQ
jgi:hypothetical protein